MGQENTIKNVILFISYCTVYTYVHNNNNNNNNHDDIVNHYVSHGSTVNLRALDITKASDRLNHDGLFINLMRRFIPATLLNVLEKWLGICYTYVRQQGN